MTFNVKLGTKIKQQREKSGLKQVDLANALQISPQAVLPQIGSWGIMIRIVILSMQPCLYHL